MRVDPSARSVGRGSRGRRCLGTDRQRGIAAMARPRWRWRRAVLLRRGRSSDRGAVGDLRGGRADQSWPSSRWDLEKKASGSDYL
jgi:hypothetical protein